MDPFPSDVFIIAHNFSKINNILSLFDNFLLIFEFEQDWDIPTRYKIVLLQRYHKRTCRNQYTADQRFHRKLLMQKYKS